MELKLNESPKYLCSLSSGQSEYDKISIEYILSRETVIAQQDYICGKISASTTIIQFHDAKTNDLDRIDSKVSAITLRTSCDILRRCINNGGELCRDCDAKHAKLFHEMSREGIKAGEMKYKITEIQKEYYHNSPHHDPRIEERYGRFFLSYTCPMFGYRELIFPIFFEEKVIAVFFNGQLKLTDDKTIIKENKENFFNNNLDIFNAYLEECKKQDDYKTNPEKYTYKAIEKYITENKREINPYYPQIYDLEQGLQIPIVKDILSTDDYNKMVKEICEWLGELEEMLVTEMQRKREIYTRYALVEALSSFHVDSAGIDSSFSIQKMLWTPVKRFAEKISEQCALEYMAVYGVRTIGKRDVSSLKIVALSNPNNRPVVPSFSLKDLAVDSMMDKPLNSKDASILFNELNPIPSEEEQITMSAIFQPMKEISAASVAILVKYSDEMLKKSIEDALISGLQNLTALISLRLAVRFENAAQQFLKNTLRLYKHEMVNLTSDINRAIHDYLGNPKLLEIDQKKINDVYRDATDTLDMFEFMSKNIGILTGEPIPPKKKNVPIYHDLLYKWENNKRIDTWDKGCDIDFRKSHVNIYTDPRYAEIVVYNLLTNAVKYAYDNTMIYMHCMKSPWQNMHILAVTNFTFTIRESVRRKIFEMGYRTRNAREYYPEGSGIGLSLIRRAMEILGGNVKLCEPEWISDYNIPLLHAYVNNPDFYANAGTIEDLEEAKTEYNRLSDEYIINDFGEQQSKLSWVMSKYNWYKPAKSMVQAELHNATYKIRFEVNFYG